MDGTIREGSWIGSVHGWGCFVDRETRFMDNRVH